VLDVGCGSGEWLAAFAGHGVEDILSVDLEPPAACLAVPEANVCRLDLNEPFDLGRTFDLIVSVEVAEHLEGDPSAFVRSLARHGDAVLFSAAAPGQGGLHHVNEQWLSYWTDRFAVEGFEVFDYLRPRMWNDQRVEWWYRQNAILLARAGAAETLRRLPPPGPLLDVVHPELWAHPRAVGLREAVTEVLPYAAMGTLRRRLAAGRAALERQLR
jgi:SAM-dependent methyltransferase